MTRQQARLYRPIASLSISAAVIYSPLWDRIGWWRTIALAICLSLLASEYIDHRTSR